MSTIRRLSAIAALIFTASVPSVLAQEQAQPTMPEALKHAPASSHLVIVLPDLDAANQAIGNFTQQVGIPAPPNMGPLDVMLRQVGVTQGLDRNGSAALVVPFLQLMGEPKMYLVLPVADEQQFRANFTALEASTESEGVLVGRPARGGMSGELFVKLVDGYAIVSEREDTLADHAVADDASAWMERGGPLGRRAAEAAHGFLLVNMEKVGPMLQGMFNMGLMQMQQQMQAVGGMAGPGADPASIEAILALYRQLGKMVLSESRQLTVGLDFARGGLDYDVALQFKPESTGARMFAAASGGEGGPGFDRLADKPFLFAMAWDNQGVDMQPLVEVMRNDVVNQLGEESAGRDLIDLYADGMAMMKDFNSAQIAWFAPEGAGMDALFNIAGVYVAEDPQRFYEQTVSMYQRMVQVMNKAVEAEEAGMAPKAYFEPNAATLDGAPVSKFGFEMPEGMAGGVGGMGMPMNPMLSPEAMTYWIAPSEAGMLFAMGPDHNALQSVKRTAGGGGELTARAAIAAGRKALPADRFAELHWDFAGMVRNMMNVMMGQMGGGGGPQIPDLPPVSVALSSEAGGGAMYTHVPTEMIQGAVQAWMGMQMGGPGGPGGPMPPGVEVVPPQGGFEAEPGEAEPMGEGGGAPAGRAEVIAVTDADWAGEVLEAEGPVLVELYADWSDPALRQQPITDALADQFAGRVKVVRVDIDANPQIVERLQPKTLPSLVILDGGQTVETFEGPTARSTLVAALEKVAE